jgi:hypothetical protein
LDGVVASCFSYNSAIQSLLKQEITNLHFNNKNHFNYYSSSEVNPHQYKTTHSNPDTFVSHIYQMMRNSSN